MKLIQPHVTSIPFTATPEQEVFEYGPFIKPHSYKLIQDSTYFRDSMPKFKKMKKLPKNKPRNTRRGKQP